MKTKHIACFLAGIALLLTACASKAPDSSSAPQTSVTVPTDTTDRTTAVSNPTGTTQPSAQPTEDHSRTSAQTTGSSKTRPSSDTSYVDADGDHIYINRAVSVNTAGKRPVNSEPVSREEFMRRFPLSLPAGIDDMIDVTYYLEYRIDDGGRSIKTELESGWIAYREAENKRSVHIWVSSEKYITTCQWTFREELPVSSSIHSKDVCIVEYERNYTAQFKLDQLYYSCNYLFVWI